MTFYTAIVQHSGYGYAGDPSWRGGLETRFITTQVEVIKVLKAGGVVFGDCMAAERYIENEAYPDGSTSLVPDVPGTFSTVKIDGLALYIPFARPTTETGVGA